MEVMEVEVSNVVDLRAAYVLYEGDNIVFSPASNTSLTAAHELWRYACTTQSRVSQPKWRNVSVLINKCRVYCLLRRRLDHLIAWYDKASAQVDQLTECLAELAEADLEGAAALILSDSPLDEFYARLPPPQDTPTEFDEPIYIPKAPQHVEEVNQASQKAFKEFNIKYLELKRSALILQANSLRKAVDHLQELLNVPSILGCGPTDLASFRDTEDGHQYED